jgi:O-antigen biosynthesis protein
MVSIAVCAAFKDEGADLTEWVAYHRVIGVDHFVLYDNESSDDGASLLLASSFKSHVTVIPMAGRPVQQLAFKHFIDFYAHNCDWVAFIDIDEFIHPINTDSIKGLLSRYDGFSAVLLNWLTFGPNGHIKRPNGLVIENYTQRLPDDDIVNRHVKSLVRTSHLLGLMGTAHVFDTAGQACNSRAEPAPKEPIQQNVCHDVICVNHYYTKSRADWDLKQKRGRPDVPELRVDPQYATFSQYDQASVVSDKRITRFADKLKQMLKD